LSLRRLFLVGAIGLPIIVVTDLVIAWFKLAGNGLLESVTGGQIAARGVALAFLLVIAGLASVGWRRGRLSDRRIARLLTAATALIALWIGVGVAMTRIPPPQYFVPTNIQQIFMGFEVSGPPTLAVLFGQWRPNLLFVSIAAAAIAVYFTAVA